MSPNIEEKIVEYLAMSLSSEIRADYSTAKTLSEKVPALDAELTTIKEQQTQLQKDLKEAKSSRQYYFNEYLKSGGENRSLTERINDLEAERKGYLLFILILAIVVIYQWIRN